MARERGHHHGGGLLGLQDHGVNTEKLDLSESRPGLPCINESFVSGPFPPTLLAVG